MSRKIQVVVIGNNNAGKEESNLAYEVGKIIGESGAILITGGKFGVMKSVSKGAKEAKGLVLSLLPDSHFDGGNEYGDIVIPTGIGYARNLVNILSGDLIVAIGGASGTLSELAYAWQFAKKIFAFTNVTGWSKLIGDMQRIDNKHDILITPIQSITDFKEQYLSWLKNMKNSGLETIHVGE